MLFLYIYKKNNKLKEENIVIGLLQKKRLEI
jgi:hypothetical protein